MNNKPLVHSESILQPKAVIHSTPLVHETPRVAHGPHVVHASPIVQNKPHIHSAGPGSHHHEEDYHNEKPDPFHFEYGVNAEKYHTNFQEARTGDGQGNIKGEYTVALPDGRIQHVSYIADNYGGTTMQVTYEGEAKHPEIVHAGHDH